MNIKKKSNKYLNKWSDIISCTEHFWILNKLFINLAYFTFFFFKYLILYKFKYI